MSKGRSTLVTDVPAQPPLVLGSLFRSCLMMTAHLVALPSIARTSSHPLRLILVVYTALELVTLACKKKSGFDHLESLRPYENWLTLARRVATALVYSFTVYYWTCRGYPLEEFFIAATGLFWGEILVRSSDFDDHVRTFCVVLSNMMRYYLIFQSWTWTGDVANAPQK